MKPRRGRSEETALLLYTSLTNVALIAAAILLGFAAVESDDSERGTYIALTIVVGTMALALCPLTVALWRRYRGSAT
jgi:hypothetical protein